MIQRNLKTPLKKSLQILLLAKVLLYVLFLIGLNGCQKRIPYEDSFKYHVPITPQTYDPILQKGTAARFLLVHLYRPLLSYNKDNELIFNAADKCFWNKKTHYTCLLKKNLKFEDGSPILALHYKNSFELIQKQKTQALLLFQHLKNKNPVTDIKTPNNRTISFHFKTKQPFLARMLSDIAYSPRKEKKLYPRAKDVISSGSFKISHIKKNQYIHLSSNNINNKVFGLKPRPNVLIYFIEDESTALRLFKSHNLDLVRNLPRIYFDKYKKQIKFVNMMRMDGLGFGPELLKNKDLRIALSHSLKFSELKKIYKSIGMPGCPALSKKLYNQNHCYKFDLKKAKKHFKKVPKKLRHSQITLSFSEVGGEDVKKGMEWLAYQWKKNLDFKVSIEPLESGQFFQKIRDYDFDIIRKGLPLDSPTCLEALQSFHSNSTNNFAAIQNKDLDKVIQTLEQTTLAKKNKKKLLCDQGLNLIQKTYHFIPLGEIYFAFLSNQKFKGWTINSLNIINLDRLHIAKDPTP